MGLERGVLLTYRIKQNLIPWLLLAPALLAIFTFVFLPTFYVIYLSLLHWNLIAKPRFVGLKNYTSLPQLSGFHSAFVNTILYSLGVTGTVIPAGLGLAILLNQGLAGTKIYRSLLFIPYVLPLVGSGIAWSWLFNRYGFIDNVLHFLGMVRLHWLGSSHLALIAVMLVSFWQYLGFYMLIFLGGLQAIDPILYEAAKMDGAGSWSTFWHMTLPSLAPSLLFALTTSVIQSFQVFDQIYVMTRGGPGTSSTTLVYFIYSEGFKFYSIGKASTVSVILLLSLAFITWLQFTLARRWAVSH